MRTTGRTVLVLLLVTSAVLQLAGQAVLRTSSAWTASHVLLALAALALLAAVVLLVAVVGPGPATWVGLGLFVVGQALTLGVLAIDLAHASVPIDVMRTLDTWDFLAVLGLVLLLLELRRRRPDLGLGADLALLGLAVPPVGGLVLVAAGAVVLGFAALTRALVASGRTAPIWLTGAVLVAYVVAASVSWPRAALAVLVLAWTVHQLRTRTGSGRTDAD